MGRFTDALNAGLETVDIAERNRAEINDVVTALSTELSSGMGGQLAVKLKSYFADEDSPFALALAGLGTRPRQLFLVAYRPDRDNVEAEKLTEWNVDHSGYPVTLNYWGTKVSCDDRVGLENALERMLQTTSVAEKIKKLLRA